ncbi:hypothetical protein MKX01_029687 [Papaver californicum]|nr:hypothetical protein MKX01_029687 [Papaver californicum]
MAENQDNLISHTSGEINYVVPKFDNGISQTPSRDSEAKLSGCSHSYMVVFPYGSTELFNMLDGEADGHLKIIERHASGLAETGKDGASFQNYHIKKSNLPMWIKGGQGYVMLQRLDIDGIRVINSVLGQIIALGYYFPKEENKARIIRKKRMYQLVGRANSTLVELVFKLGLFERSKIAFMEDHKYSRMLEYLKDHFEFNQKIVGVDFYLRHIVAAQGLVVLCAGLVFCFSPLIISLSSLGDIIMTKINTVKVTY